MEEKRLAKQRTLSQEQKMLNEAYEMQQKIEEERRNARSEMSILRKQIQSCKDKYEEERKAREK